MSDFNLQQQQPTVDLGQLKNMRQQQVISKLQNKIQIALQMFLYGRANTLKDAFILAEEFMEVADEESKMVLESLAQNKTI